MKRLLGSLLLLTLLVVGCGGGDAGRADDPAADPTRTSPSGPASGSPASPSSGAGTDDGPAEGWRLVEIVHATAAGGEVVTTPVPVSDSQALADFTSQFERPDLRREMQRVIRGAATPAGYQLVAAVIAIGCDVPPGVTYVDGQVYPQKVAKPLGECFAAVTSVAILEVPA